MTTENEMLKANVMKRLEKTLAEIEALPALPEVGTPEYHEMGQAEWSRRFKEIEQKEEVAIHVALLLLPKDVEALLSKVKRAAYSRMMSGKE